MSSDRLGSITLQQHPDAVFQAALGVLQHSKSATLLAAHNGGRRLIARDKAKMSNPKIFNIIVKAEGGASELYLAVDTDPRSPKALLDGRANEKALKKYLEAVSGALDGSAPAPATPVSDHFVQKKNQLPWADPEQDPAIELGGALKAAYGL